MKPKDDLDMAEQTLDFVFETAKRSAVVGAISYAVSKLATPALGVGTGAGGLFHLATWVWVKSHQMRYVPDGRGGHTTWQSWAVKAFAWAWIFLSALLVWAAAAASGR